LGKTDVRQQYPAFVDPGISKDTECTTAKFYTCINLGDVEIFKEALKKLKEESVGKADISHRRLSSQPAGVRKCSPSLPEAKE
jgi:hypothetical protein